MAIYVYHNPEFLAFYRDPALHTLDLGRLYLAAIVETDDPEIAYRLTQHVDHLWHESSQVTTVTRSRSTSVGDMLALEDGRLLVVKSLGFAECPEMALPAERSRLLRWMRATVQTLEDLGADKPAALMNEAVRQVGHLYTALLFAQPILAADAADPTGEQDKPYRALLARFASEQARWALAQADGGQ
jgi:hypothetical protein